jgi:hypothetical protein
MHRRAKKSLDRKKPRWQSITAKVFPSLDAFYDVCTLLLAVIDLVSDVLICIQFYQEGQRVE